VAQKGIMTELTLSFFGHIKRNSVKDRKSPKKINFYAYWCFIYERILSSGL